MARYRPLFVAPRAPLETTTRAARTTRSPAGSRAARRPRSRPRGGRRAGGSGPRARAGRTRPRARPRSRPGRAGSSRSASCWRTELTPSATWPPRGARRRRAPARGCRARAAARRPSDSDARLDLGLGVARHALAVVVEVGRDAAQVVQVLVRPAPRLGELRLERAAAGSRRRPRRPRAAGGLLRGSASLTPGHRLVDDLGVDDLLVAAAVGTVVGPSPLPVRCWAWAWACLVDHLAELERGLAQRLQPLTGSRPASSPSSACRPRRSWTGCRCGSPRRACRSCSLRDFSVE